MTRHVGLLAAIATAALLTPTPAPAAGPAATSAQPLHFTLTLTRPMLANGYVKLEPGDYDVAFRPSPPGCPISSRSSRAAARTSQPRRLS